VLSVSDISAWKLLLCDSEPAALTYDTECAAITGVTLQGNNVLVLKEHDVKVMTDLMMGGDGTNTAGEITELHLSAASEAMNQMMGTSATSLSSMLGIATDISTPIVNQIDVESIKVFEKMFDTTYDKFVKIAFRMTIGDLIDSIMVQLYPVQFAQDMCNKFMDKGK
jgi:flagellar motor switch protein FliN/FliY